MAPGRVSTLPVTVTVLHCFAHFLCCNFVGMRLQRHTFFNPAKFRPFDGVGLTLRADGWRKPGVIYPRLTPLGTGTEWRKGSRGLPCGQLGDQDVLHKPSLEAWQQAVFSYLPVSCQFGASLQVMRRMLQLAGTRDEPRARWKFIDTSDKFLARRLKLGERDTWVSGLGDVR